jgi:PAS domain S-box-containing protein
VTEEKTDNSLDNNNEHWKKIFSRFPYENPNPVLCVSRDGTILFSNDPARNYLVEWDCSEGSHLPTSYCSKVAEVVSQGTLDRIRVKHGPHLLSLELVPIPGEDYVCIYGHDITRETLAEEELLKLSKAVKETADIVFITDNKGNIEYVNRSFEVVTGYTMNELRGKTPAILNSGAMDSHFYKHFWKTINSGKVFRAIILNRKKNGELLHTLEKSSSGTRFESVTRPQAYLPRTQVKLVSPECNGRQQVCLNC